MEPTYQKGALNSSNFPLNSAIFVKIFIPSSISFLEKYILAEFFPKIKNKIPQIIPIIFCIQKQKRQFPNSIYNGVSLLGKKHIQHLQYLEIKIFF